MGLNDINLPAALVAAIYKNHLIEIDQPDMVNTLPANAGLKNDIQYLGKNQKKVCLLVSYADEVYLPDHELQFLTSILQACKLNLGDVAIINFQQQQISFSALRQQIACDYLLIFGIQEAGIGLGEMPLFTAQTVDGCQIVCSPAAEQLNNNSAESKVLKGRLWLCLKQLFAI